MYTLILLVCCTGFFCLYNSSRRAKLAAAGVIEFWLQCNQKAARALGLTAIMLSIAGLMLLDGPLMGTLHGSLMLMTAGCYIISLAPFRLIRLSHILGLGVIALLFEFLIF